MYSEIKATPHAQPSQVRSLQQSTLEHLVSTPKKYNAKDNRQVQITVSFIAGDLLPLSTIESPHFHTLMGMADARYQVPSRKHLSTKLMPQRREEIHESLMMSLKKTEMICVTVDLWSSRQMRNFFWMTAHYVADWSLKSAMLACSRFHGSHTADAIAEEFETSIASFQISRKVAYTITDRASNMIKAFSLPGFSAQRDDSDDDSEVEDEFETPSVLADDIYGDITNEHIPCFAHTMQLTIKDGFKQASSINKVLSKASGIVSHVKKLIHSSEILESEKRLKAANV